ncbi:MAG: hypothetical protein A2W36_01705 [Chloroflexi bacterium RBG_16_58_14]|nr:MAG: hypothetical protein A2W36_01705 [Chloroflexi bacterium RBG_16_58_14]
MGKRSGQDGKIHANILWLLACLVVLAAAPAQGDTPPPPTPTPVSLCPPPLQDTCIWVSAVQQTYGLPPLTWALVLAVVLLILAAFGRGLLKWVETRGEVIPSAPLSWFKRRAATRRYLEAFIAENRHFGFRGIEALALKPIELDQAYVTLDLILQPEPSEAAWELQKANQQAITGFHLSAGERIEPVDISHCLGKSQKIALIGDAGSGKSALLQWAGLAVARYQLGHKLTTEQRRFGKALGANRLFTPLVPVLIPLRDYHHECKDKNISRNTESLLQFLAGYAKQHYPKLKLPDDFITRVLERGCLLMFDGVDEVPHPERGPVRASVEGVISLTANNPRNRYLITSRPSAAYITAQIPDFRQADVQLLTPEKRQALIWLWCDAVYPTDDESHRKAIDLNNRISDERVESIAQTPLLVNLFALVYYYRRELPSQRAELYEYAVQALLTDPHKEGESALELQKWGGLKWQQRRDALALVAYILHDTGAESVQAEELISQRPFWQRFGNDRETAHQAASEFLETAATRGGLLRQDGQRYDFYIRRFREFLAGRYLAQSLENRWINHFQKHVVDDQWEEPIQLAAGFLAFSNLEKAEKFMRQLSTLKGSDVQQAYAIALAGLALADLLQTADAQVKNVFAHMRNNLPPQLSKIIEKTPSVLRLPLRRRLGLALGAVGDPRFDPLHPHMLPVPAGSFRMGTSPEDEERLKHQETTSWDDEKPAHITVLSDYEIGKYPVTNLEFRSFWDDRGYEQPKYWSPDGRLWRTGEWESDLSVYPEDFQETLRKWLAGRPVERRDRPFWWDDPEWNAPNLPVVGVCWFEAEAYCNWLSAVSERPFRLPTEAEWEKAARGAQAFLWPWGDTWEASRCNSSEAEEAERLYSTTPVGMYPHGASPYGALDMAGNVWEWCQDWYDPEEYQRRAGSEVINPPGPEQGPARVVRGGSWNGNRRHARCASRGRFGPDAFSYLLGFRLVCLPQ